MNRIMFWFGFTIIISLFAVNQSNAQWVQSNGPFGGKVYALMVSGSDIFAGTDGAIYRSTNNGNSWVGANNNVA